MENNIRDPAFYFQIINPDYFDAWIVVYLVSRNLYYVHTKIFEGFIFRFLNSKHFPKICVFKIKAKLSL